MNRIAFSLLASLLLVQIRLWGASLPLVQPLTDSIPPTIICPPNDTVNLAPATCTAIYPFDVTAYDDQPGTPTILQTSGLPATEPYPIGLTYNVFRATDAAGNTSTCSFTVLVKNYSVPLACEDLATVALNQNCTGQQGPLYYLFGDQNDYGCLSNFYVEVDRIAPFGNGPWTTDVFGAQDIGKTYQFRVVDGYTGNKCWGSVKVIDNLPPVLTCANFDIPCTDINPTPTNLTQIFGIPEGQPSAIDNCGGNVTTSFIDNQMPMDCNSGFTGTINRQWTAKDQSNNTITCVQQIRIIRPTLDDVVLPADVTLDCSDTEIGPDSTGFPHQNVLGMQIAQLCSINSDYSDVQDTLLCSGHRRITRRWSVINWCEGEILEYDQKIDLIDTEGPSINCPPAFTAALSGAGCTGDVDLPDVIVHDNCSAPAAFWAVWNGPDNQADTLIGSLGNFAGNNSALSDTLGILGVAAGFPVGQHLVIYYAADDCGNTASCAFTVEVWDNTPPEAACAPLQTIWLDAEGKAEVPAALFDGGSAADSCNVLNFRIRPDLGGICQPDSVFAETLLLCCAQVGDTLAATLRVYDIHLPAGTLGAGYAEGHFDECKVLIAVADTLAPACIAPPDTAVSCADFSSDLSVYGAPLLNCKADSFSIIVDYQQFDTLCKSGTLTRIFQTYANGQAGAQCAQIIQSGYHQEYYVRFPDDVIVTTCNETNVYGTPEIFHLGCEQVDIQYTDEVFTVVPDACYKIERSWTIVNPCTYDSLQPLIFIPNPNPHPQANNPTNLPGPVVSAPGASGVWAPTAVKITPVDPQATNYSQFWTASANGYRYTQTIKIVDTQPPVFSCPSGPLNWTDTSQNDAQLWHENYWANFFAGNDDLCEAPAPLGITVSDACSGSEIVLNYQLFLDLNDDGTQETVVSSTNLPPANTVYFDNAANPNFSVDQPRAFDQRPVPADQQYRFAIDRVKSGNNVSAYVRWDTEALPANSDNPDLDGIEPQLPLGTHRIKWVAQDACGNQRVCEYTFTLVSEVAGCTPPGIPIGGEIVSLTGGVSQVKVTLVSTDPIFNQTASTDVQGSYQFSQNLPFGSDFYVRPSKNDDVSNGISTFDIVLLSKHVLGIDTLDTPYQIIAADINRSNSVTTFDVVELRKLVLGIYNVFPMNTSWRFVPQEFSFANPYNPFLSPLPDSIAVVNLPDNNLSVFDFVAIKIGDLNLSAANEFNAPADDRAGAGLQFALNDRRVSAGEILSLDFQPDRQPLGFQFTLEHPGLQLLELSPDNNTLDESNFGVFEQALTMSWNGDDTPRFRAVFQANTEGNLHDMLYLSDRITPSEAYFEAEKGLAKSRVALRFNTGALASPQLFSPAPNPFTDRTNISFYLPENSVVQLRLVDLNGRVVWHEQGSLPAGHHQRTLSGPDLGAPGVYVCELISGSFRIVQKLVLLDH